tara:strand:- start:2851 stop:4272 length:1422 start_codon:yes stop_codon:yes gene_type:complete
MAITLGSGGVVPSPVKQAASSNYLNFHNGDGTPVTDWAQQYLPELYAAEVEKFGNRSVSGFLSMVGAEMPMASDQVIWSEQGRLHLHYTGATLGADSGGANTITGLTSHAIRLNDLVVIGDDESEVKAIVTAIPNANSITVKCLSNSTGCNDAGITTVASKTKLFVFGSEFKKGTVGQTEAIEPKFLSLTNKPFIIKDFYKVSGSDASQIGWVEVTGEGGQSGFMWYLKAEGDTRMRFNDYLEMSIIEAEKVVNTNISEAEGSEGLFAAIKDRGHFNSEIDNTGSGAAAANLADFDAMLKKLDKQGAIEENVIFANKSLSLTIDDMLAGIGNAGYSNGTSFGVFQNSEDMALNLGFSGFRRGGYDFYKTDWKYLNDAATRGIFDADGNDTFVRGVVVPAGTSTVYDQVIGKNLKRPYLHVRYRASESDSRKMKIWVTGSVGAATSDLDAMNVHYLSERCLVVQGANNFVLING